MPDTVASRLRLVRLAYMATQKTAPSQAKFARLVGMTPQTWNNAESGDNQIGIKSAIKLRCTTGATLDYIFCGDISALPYSLAVQIRKIERQRRSP